MKIGIKGISYSATERKYLVRVTKNEKRVYLGRFSSLEEAKKALEENQGQGTAKQENPILASIRAEFAPKKAKTQRDMNNVLSSKPNSGSVKNLPTAVKSDSAPAKKHLKSDQSLFESILLYLLDQANVRKTSVFDVVVQEVARLSKK